MKPLDVIIAAALVLASGSESGQAQQFQELAVPPVLSGSLEGPNVREALRGSISPDGRLLAYEVVVGHDRNIWLRNLGSGEARALTAGRGGNRGAVWSRDGSKIAFVVADSMIAVADVSTGTHRIVFDGTPTKYYRPIVNLLRWYSDSELTVGYLRAGLSGLRQSLWAVRIDNTGGHEIPRLWADSVAGTTLPDGKWVATRTATAAGRGGLWALSTLDHHGRCLAGFLTGDSRPFWSPGSDALLFIGQTGADTTPRVYQLPLHGGPARPVSAVTGSAFSLSINERGDVAIITRANGTVVAGDLWLGHYPLAVNERDTLAHCHDLPADVVRWVKRQRLPALHGVSELTAVPDQDLSLFHAVYGYAGDVSPDLLGLRYRGRIGWLIAPQPSSADGLARRLTRFDLRPGDRYLLSPEWDTAVANVSSQATAWWRNILVSSPATPLSRLAQLVAQDPSLATAAAQNPALGSTTVSERALLELAAVSPIVAMRVMDNPRIAHDLGAWRWIEARYQNRPDAFELLRNHLWERERDLVSDSLVPEPVWLEFIQNPHSMTSNGDTLLFRLLANPVARRSQRILTILATDRRDVPNEVRRRAVTALARRGVTRGQAVRAVLQAQGADSVPCDEMGVLLGPWGLGDEATAIRTDFATTQSDRCSALRRQVGLDLADNPYTPPASLRALAVWVAESPNEPIAAALITNQTVRSDSEALRLLTALPLSRVAQQADSLLRSPEHWARDREATVTWDTTSWGRADSGTSVSLVPASYVFRVLDSASSRDTLRLVIGDRDAWASWWNGHRPRTDAARPDTASVPAVDFRTYVVLAASNGENPPWPVIGFNGAWLLHDTVYVKVLTGRGIPSPCAARSLQNKVALSLMPRPKTPVVFLEGRWARRCSVW